MTLIPLEVIIKSPKKNSNRPVYKTLDDYNSTINIKRNKKTHSARNLLSISGDYEGEKHAYERPYYMPTPSSMVKK